SHAAVWVLHVVSSVRTGSGLSPSPVARSSSHLYRHVSSNLQGQPHLRLGAAHVLPHHTTLPNCSLEPTPMRPLHLSALLVGVAAAGTACGGNNGPSNTAPTAAFTPSCTDLACTFTDASSDPDA